VLSEGEAAARGGDGAAEFFGGFDPFLDDDFDVGECLRAVVRPSGDEAPFLIATVGS
jgi:hypothetical protein